MKRKAQSFLPRNSPLAQYLLQHGSLGFPPAAPVPPAAAEPPAATAPNPAPPESAMYRRRLDYWRGLLRSAALARHLATAGLAHRDQVTWEALRYLEMSPTNHWAKRKSEAVALALGMPPRPPGPITREERIEAALRAMVRHAQALIRSGVWQPFTELEAARAALLPKPRRPLVGWLSDQPEQASAWKDFLGKPPAVR